MKMLILFRGPCGCGKTYIRERMGLEGVTGLDMTDLPHDMDIRERVEYAGKWLKANASKKLVWLEGIFADASPSLDVVEDACFRTKRQIQYITCQAHVGIVKGRIGHDKARFELAKKYLAKF